MRGLLAIVITLIPSVVLAQQTPTKPPAKLTLYKTIDSAACSGDATVWVDSEAHVPGLSDVNLLGYGESIVSRAAVQHEQSGHENPRSANSLAAMNRARGRAEIGNLPGHGPSIQYSLGFISV